MEYLKRVAKALRESYWAKPGTSFKFAMQVLLTIAIIGGVTYGIDTVIQSLIKF